jgi:hypothetical protein
VQDENIRPKFGPKGHYHDRNVDELLLESYPTRMIARVLSRKIVRRMKRQFGILDATPRLRSFNGITVFGNEFLDGEGTTVGQDYMRILLGLGLTRVERIFEFCAGPGYIGYSLLGNGFCDKLSLADINPVAVKHQRETTEFNGLGSLVNSYVSDIFDSIPGNEKWDIVVSNPPHLLLRSEDDRPINPNDADAMRRIDPARQATNIKARDPDWNIHRRFYRGVKKHMKPGGLVVMQENRRAIERGMATEQTFIDMIEEGGGEFLQSLPDTNVCGHGNSMFYMVSRW